MVGSGKSSRTAYAIPVIIADGFAAQLQPATARPYPAVSLHCPPTWAFPINIPVRMSGRAVQVGDSRDELARLGDC
jgi:hypothetical protein